MNGLGCHSALQEADDLIRHWLAGVEAATSIEGEGRTLVRRGNGADGVDFLSSVDWSSGDVGQSTRHVLEGLMNKELSLCQPAVKKKSCDPLVTMEMRHKEVKRRRELREKRKREEMERRRQQQLAEREARALVMEEERRAKARAAEEDRIIDQQMKTLRKELKEREKLSRQLALEHSLITEEAKAMESSRGDGALMAEAENFLKSERQRVATRMELTRQLEEAEVKETKENVKLVHRCFQGWWEEVVRERGRLAKATAVRDWKLALRVWQAWVSFVREKREKREREEVSKWLQSEKRAMEVAAQHYTFNKLQRSLRAWHKVTRQETAEKRREETEQSHRAKMAALIQMAATRVEKQGSEQRRSLVSETAHPTMADHSPSSPSPGCTATPPTHRESSNSCKTAGSSRGAVETASPDDCATGSCGDRVRQPPTHSVKMSVKSSIWKDARKQLDHLLSHVDAPPTTAPTSTLKGSGEGATHSHPPQKPNSRPATKPRPMTAMERRSAEIAERRLAREQRHQARLREKAEQLAKEEDEQRKAEAALREARLKEKREERRLAKQQELERLERQRVATEQLAKASSHYLKAQVKWRVLGPWKRFIEEMRSKYREAEHQRAKLLSQRALLLWHKRMLQREKERERVAVRHYESFLLTKMLAAWIKVKELGRELEALADVHRPRLLLQRVLRGWCHVVREERQMDWEKMARARRFRQRRVLCSVLRAWHEFVPLAREEREREKRRNKLRLKVASWLDDYRPLPNSTSALQQ